VRDEIGARERSPAVSAMNRRTFLKAAGGGAAGAAAIAGLGPLGDAIAADPPEGVVPDRVVPTFCELCFWKCGVLAYVKDGRVYKIEGNPKHPLSNGRLCPRGAGGVGALYDPDRLRKPLIRDRRPVGDAWREASWDEALDLTARRILEVKEKHGAESIALFSHGCGGVFFKTLTKALGSVNIVAPSHDQCRGPRESAFELTYGTGLGAVEPLDVAHSRCVAFLGSHLGENMHNTAVQDLSAAAARGAVFITADPRFSVLAGKSKYWLPIKPGTDTALLLAWMNVLVEDGLYRKEFIEANAIGFDELRRHVADKTPEWAYLQTGIEPSLIRETARELAAAAPAALVHPGRHTTWYGNDTQRGRAVAILNALLGNWGRTGGFHLPATLMVPPCPVPHPPGGKAFKPGEAFPLGSTPCAYDVRESSLARSGQAGIRAWIVVGCNVPLTLPDTRRTVEAMQALDFVVSIDTMPAEVTGWSDVVLPECTYLERWDELDSPPFRRPFVAVRQPVVAPMHDTKPGWWIARSLAQRMNLADYFPWKDGEDYVRTRVASAGLSFGQLVRDGVILGAEQPIYDDAPTFRTKSGKIELFSSTLADAGLPPLPPYEPPEEPPPGYFRLLFGRSPVHTFSRTVNNPRLMEIVPENEVWMNAEMARSQGLKHGSYVLLENQDSVKSGPVRLRVTERIRQDCVYMVHGFGREDRRLRTAVGRGASDARLVTRVKRDPVMGGTGMNVNFVAVMPAPAGAARGEG